MGPGGSQDLLSPSPIMAPDYLYRLSFFSNILKLLPMCHSRVLGLGILNCDRWVLKNPALTLRQFFISAFYAVKILLNLTFL